MSHVTLNEAETKDQQITDLVALRKAAERCGLVFKEGQRSFHTWASDHGGQLVGDYPLPEGYSSINDLGNACEHAIGLPRNKDQGMSAYEIGVVNSKRFPGTYSLAYDFFGGALDKLATTEQGRKNVDKGGGLDKLRMFYQMEAARNLAGQMGDLYSEAALEDGSYKVTIDTTVRMGQ